MPQTFGEHQNLLESLVKTQISWITPRDSDLVDLGCRPMFICFKSISPSDFEKGAIKSFVFPNVESLGEEGIGARKHSVLHELIVRSGCSPYLQRMA